MSDSFTRESFADSGKNARISARSVLGENANRLCLVLAGIFAAAVSFVTGFAVSLTLGQFSWNPYVGLLLSDLLTLLLFVLFAMPVWLGMYRMAVRMALGAATGFSDLFHYASSARLWGRALGMSLPLLWRWLPAVAGVVMIQFFFGYDYIGFLLALFLLLTALISLTFVTGLSGFVTLAAADDDLPLPEARDLAADSTVGLRMRFLRRDLGLAGRVFLSLLPVGLVFFLHTLPMEMLSSAFYVLRLAESRTDFEIHSEKEL